MKKPPFSISPLILMLSQQISLLIGRYEGLQVSAPQPQLRKQNRIRTIKDSLAIEGNTLTIEMVSALFDEKKVLGPPKDILEVQNAIRLYSVAEKLSPLALKDFLKAHGILMKDLVKDAGKLRNSNVGIFKGNRVSHVAPPAHRVPELMIDLFEYLKQDKETSSLIKSCILHYEIECIHPFSDGNGRMGRFFQHLYLFKKVHKLFEFLPIESLIKANQNKYYNALEKCDRQGDSTLFVEFLLEVILQSLEGFLTEVQPAPMSTSTRLERAQVFFKNQKFSRKQYIQLIKTVSSATASRDLNAGVQEKKLVMHGIKAQTKYQFKS